MALVDDVPSARTVPGPGYRFLVGAGAFVLVVAGLREGADVLQPVVLALFLGFLSSPLVQWLRRLRWPRRAGLPHGVAVGLTFLSVLAALTGLVFLVRRAVTQVIAAAPRYAPGLQRLADDVVRLAARFDLPLSQDTLHAFATPERVLGLARGTAASALGFVSNFLLVAFVLLFLLLELPDLPQRIEHAFGKAARVWEGIESSTRQIQPYVRLKALISALNSVLFGVVLVTLGVDFVGFWMGLTFALNFVPNVGSILSTVLPATLALLQHGLPTAVGVVVSAIVIDQFLGRVVEPRLMAQSLGLSPAFVMLALVFWGWVWGALGVVLAVPLTVTVKVFLENVEDLRWLAALMEATPRTRPRDEADRG